MVGIVEVAIPRSGCRLTRKDGVVGNIELLKLKSMLGTTLSSMWERILPYQSASQDAIAIGSQCARPGFEQAFCDASAECFAQGSKGLVADAELLYRHWAFDVAKITLPVHMWQGLADTLPD